MLTITLAVTQSVIDQATAEGRSQMQLAIQDCSSEVREALALATGTACIPVVLGRCVHLDIGDTAAVWRSHNQARSEDFDLIYGLLARRPGQGMTFLCTLHGRDSR